MKALIFCSLCIAFLFFNAARAANPLDVMINEIMYDLPGADDNREWIEIYNPTSFPADLTGWKFNDGSNHILNPPPKNGGQGSLILPPKGYAVLADNASSFLTEHPEFSGTVIDTVMSLKNTTATIKIIDNEGKEIDSLTYDKNWGGAGNGKTLEKINPTGNNEFSNWKESLMDGGTPGNKNSVCLTGSEQQFPKDESSTSQQQPQKLPDATPSPSLNQPPVAEAGSDIIALVGREITFDGSKSSDPDNNQLTYFWNFGDGATSNKMKEVHIFQYPGIYTVSLTVSDGLNSTTDTLKASIFVKSLVISEFIPNPQGRDEENEWIELYNDSDQTVEISGWQLKSESKSFTFPDQSFISPKQFLVLPVLVTRITLGNKDGILELYYPNGVIAQKIEYLDTKEGWSIAKFKDEYLWTNNPTPGFQNKESSELPADKTSTTSKEISSDAPRLEYTVESPSTGSAKVLSKAPRSELGSKAQPNSSPQAISEQIIKEETSPTKEEAPLTASLRTPDAKTKNLNLWLVIFGIIIFSAFAGWGLIKIKNQS